MAENNLKDFTVNWILFGLLMFAMLSFAINFMLDNNPDGLGFEANEILGISKTNLSDKLIEVGDNADSRLNVTAGTNPEGNFLGSRDSVSTSFSLFSSAKKFWVTTISLIWWIFGQEFGSILIGVFGGLIGILAVYYITKWIRQGG